MDKPQTRSEANYASFKRGCQTGYDEGYEVGWNDGHKLGYSDGYQQSSEDNRIKLLGNTDEE